MTPHFYCLPIVNMQWIFYGLVFVVVAGITLPVMAANRLRIIDSGVIIYTGPNSKFRPLKMAKVGDTFPVSNERAKSDVGDYYIVLVEEKSQNGKGRTGFIPMSSAVEVVSDHTDNKMVEFTAGKSMYSSAVLIGFYAMPKDQFLWNVAYQHYIGAGIFYRLIVGENLTESLGSTMYGGELGNEQSISTDISLNTFVGAGGLLAPKEHLIFAGSKQLSYYAHGGFGIRYDADEFAAVGLMVMQVAVFNNNNSKLNYALGMTLEVGL